MIWKKQSLNSYDIGKIILQCMHIWMKHKLQKHPYRVHLALWIDCCRLASAFNNASFALCAQYWREWSSNEILNLFVPEFNARVNWIRSATRVWGKPGYQSLMEFWAFFQKNVIFMQIFKKMLCWSMFYVKPLNKLPTTYILNWGPCFCMVQFIRDSSFM